MADDKFEIKVSTLGDKEGVIEVTSSNTIEELKKIYEEKENIPVADQKLFLNEVELEDAKTVADSGIEKDTTINLVLSYDCIVMGTGLKECILSGLMSVERRKVLHLDRNDYYGGESASLSLDQMYEKYREGSKPPESLGRSRDYNIDQIPKFVMGTGTLVNLLLYTSTQRYLDFKVVDGSYVYRGGKIYKVPVTAPEVMGSSLLGFFEKRKCKQFVDWVNGYDPANPKSTQGIDINTAPMKDVYKYFGLGPDIQDFIGHSFALFSDDTYLEKPAAECLDRVRLYVNSLSRYESSPYLYPLYGLGDVPQGFARLCAIYGGTYMLRQTVDSVLYDEAGKVSGIVSGGEKALCKMVIGDPSYFPEKTKKTGQIVRAICILSHPIPNTSDCESCQIILPQRQIKRNSDIYVFCVSAAHQIAPAGKWVAIVSTRCETSSPEKELEQGLALLGKIDESFVSVSDMFEATNDPKTDGCYITSTYDEMSHFQSTCKDVCDLYKSITGSEIDFKNPPPQPGTPGFDEYTGPSGASTSTA